MRCPVICVNENTENASVQSWVYVCDTLRTVSLGSLTCHKTVWVAPCPASIFFKTTPTFLTCLWPWFNCWGWMFSSWSFPFLSDLLVQALALDLESSNTKPEWIIGTLDQCHHLVDDDNEDQRGRRLGQGHTNMAHVSKRILFLRNGGQKTVNIVSNCKLE